MAGAPARWDLEADGVSIGSGLGGLTAAIVAHDQGASCVVLEKAGKLGGLSGFGGGEVFVPANHKMKELGLADT
ncbi:MAG: FAD-binding protein, partial [Myxococcales bacterium]